MTQGKEKRRVLVVDDEEPLCDLVCQKLSLHGFETRGCLSGEKAIEALRKETFDAVISDLKLPGISGLELLKEASAHYRHLAFVMVTGVDDTRVGIQAMKEGADDYLVKPHQMDGIVTSVERAIEKKRLETEVENYRARLEEMVEHRTRQLQTAMKRIELTYDETLEALGAALDLRDTETAGHSRRVSRYSQEIARTMGRGDEELKQIARGSYLHDIGKIGIPDSILLKPGKLTEEETAIMQTHARIGYDLVSRIAFLTPAAEIVLTHQERFDGTGYPQGLMGEEIPIGARIFAVADTLDAMTSDRPYRRALPMAHAREEIERTAGFQFDPKVVQAFLAISEDVWMNIRLEVAGLRKVYPPAEKAA